MRGKDVKQAIKIMMQRITPALRGKAKKDHRAEKTARITPAYAGKSHVVDSIWPAFWDHPRVCGEKPSYDAGKAQQRGITPAYAGKRPLQAFGDIHG